MKRSSTNFISRNKSLALYETGIKSPAFLTRSESGRMLGGNKPGPMSPHSELPPGLCEEGYQPSRRPDGSATGAFPITPPGGTGFHTVTAPPIPGGGLLGSSGMLGATVTVSTCAGAAVVVTVCPLAVVVTRGAVVVAVVVTLMVEPLAVVVVVTLTVGPRAVVMVVTVTVTMVEAVTVVVTVGAMAVAVVVTVEPVAVTVSNLTMVAPLTVRAGAVTVLGEHEYVKALEGLLMPPFGGPEGKPCVVTAGAAAVATAVLG